MVLGSEWRDPHEHMGILFAHARDEWNNLSSAPFV